MMDDGVLHGDEVDRRLRRLREYQAYLRTRPDAFSAMSLYAFDRIRSWDEQQKMTYLRAEDFAYWMRNNSSR